MIRLTGSGPEVVKDDGWAELREGFERRHCVLLKDFLERRVAARLRQVLPRTQGPGFDTREHRAHRSGVLLARELELDGCAPASVMLFLLLNQPRLFAALGELAGGDEAIRHFDGRCYMMRPEPGAEHFHDWHNDCVDGRQLGLSINLSPEPFAGGEFQLRDAGAGGLPHTIVPGRFGDATLFRIAPSLKHRVRRVRGTVPKIAFAGWFTGHFDYRDVLRTFMEGLQPARAGRRGWPRSPRRIGAVFNTVGLRYAAAMWPFQAVYGLVLVRWMLNMWTACAGSAGQARWKCERAGWGGVLRPAPGRR